MNEHEYNEVDKLLDEIIFLKADEEKLAELMREKKRSEVIEELILHQTAASAVQRQEVIGQVAKVHQAFLEKRNGFTAQENSQAPIVSSRQKIVRFVYAAAAVLILIPATVFLYLYITSSPEQLFKSEYQAYHFNVDRSVNVVENSKVVTLYQQGKFNEAVVASKNTATLTANEQMAVGFSYMELKQFSAASNQFESVLNNNKLNNLTTYQDEAEYYLALSYLQMHQVDKAYTLFSKIYLDKEHTYNRRIDKWFITRLQWLK